MSEDPNTLIEKIVEQYDADILLYAGQIRHPWDDDLIEKCREKTKENKQRKNILLLITTPGGDPHSAYRIARCLQRCYNTVKKSESDGAENGNFYVFVDTVCASAGTILSLGSSELIMSDYAQIGPIDVQVRKPDEVGERTSGLTPAQSLQSLERYSRRLLKSHFDQLRFGEDLSLTTRTSVDIAAQLTIGLLEPVYAQIDPMRLGEMERLLEISTAYGERIGKSNLKDDALPKLLAGYPSHNFVIDREEAASDLFERVSKPTSELEELGEFLRPLCENRFGDPNPLITFVSDVIDRRKEADDGSKDDGQGGTTDGNGESQGGGRTRSKRARRKDRSDAGASEEEKSPGSASD